MPASLSAELLVGSGEALNYLRARVAAGAKILHDPDSPEFSSITRGADRAALTLLTAQIRIDETALKERREDAWQRLVARMAENPPPE